MFNFSRDIRYLVTVFPLRSNPLYHVKFLLTNTSPEQRTEIYLAYKHDGANVIYICRAKCRLIQSPK